MMLTNPNLWDVVMQPVPGDIQWEEAEDEWLAEFIKDQERQRVKEMCADPVKYKNERQRFQEQNKQLHDPH